MIRSSITLLAQGILILGLSIPMAAMAQAPGTDAFIYDSIDTLLSVAEAISIDGVSSDWGAIPGYGDAVGDVGDSSLDIIEVAIAPLDQEVILRLRTSGSPNLTAYSFSFLLDLAGGVGPRVQLLLDPVGGSHLLNILDEITSAVLSTSPIPGIGVAVGVDTIEASIPYSVLGPLLPSDLATAIQSANHRSWVRGISVSLANGAIADRGPGATSYRLIPTPYPLDPDLPSGLPNANDPPIEMQLPMTGEWLIGQGADGSFSHNNCWCYDFVVADSQYSTSDPPESLNNADYFAWGETVTAPIAGTITTAVGSNPDVTPGTPGTNNNVIRIAGSGAIVTLLHFMQGSLAVNVGDSVGQVDAVGLVGNAGFTTQPHPHLQARTTGSTGPISMDVVVRLNPTPDPWERRIVAWEPREGFFVERLEISPAVPTGSLPTRTALVALLAGIAIAASIRHRREIV